MKRKEIHANLLFLLIGCALFLPAIPITVVPESKIEVVDAAGYRVPGVPVDQISQHYTFEFREHRETQESDLNGLIVFPQRRIWIGSLWCVVGQSWSFVASINPHSSSGPSDYYMPAGFEGMANGERERPIRLVLGDRTSSESGSR